jgi:hypothetical protein
LPLEFCLDYQPWVPHIPDFLLNLLGSAKFMRLSLEKGALAVLSSATCRNARCGPPLDTRHYESFTASLTHTQPLEVRRPSTALARSLPVRPVAQDSSVCATESVIDDSLVILH